MLGIDVDLPDSDDARPRTGDDLTRRHVAIIGAIEDEHTGSAFFAAAANHDEIVNRVDGDAADLVEHRFVAAYGAQGSGVSAGFPRINEYVLAAIFAHEEFVIFQIESDGFGAQQPSVRPLDHADRRFFSAGVSAEGQDSAGEMHRYDDLVMHGIVNDSVHGAAQLGSLSFDHSYRALVPICQPGKGQNSGHAHSIGN